MSAAKPNSMSSHTQGGSIADCRLQSTGDRIGMWASIACAVHCALLPLALVLAPALGLGIIGWLDMDQLFAIVATVLGVTMLILGYRRHRTVSVWILMLAGLALIWANAFTPLHQHGLWHAVMMVTGGLMIAWAHWRNTRLTAHAHKHGACRTSDSSTRPAAI